MNTYRVTFARVVRSEWTKLLSLRSTWIVLGALAVATTVLAGVIGWVANREPGTDQTLPEAVGRAFLGVDLATFVLGVLGILLVTGEYGSGLIRATLAAVPRRLPVLGAKALALVTLTVPVMAAACVASLLAGQAFVDADQRVGFGDPVVLRATAGAAAAPVALGLIGLGIGAMVRHTAAAIAVYVAGALVLPALIPAALPDSWHESVLPYVPVAASQAMYSAQPDSAGSAVDLLSPGAGALVMLAWVLAVLAGGAAVLRRRDA
jgi:hypothetical protein